ncbi:MAG: hypothetical protein KatS3mg105_3470 [Gemmatales bacterium]|nr:MAG: hypothetical protein KatS3mg105_3470 [Gemmatales bacterium]
MRGLLLAAACTVFVQNPQPKATLPPLSEDQVARLRRLVQTTQQNVRKIQTQLDDLESRLAQVYGQYDLDEQHAQELIGRIVDLQRQKLENYQRMHIELRKIVGKERFEILKERLRRAGYFGSKTTEKEKAK